MTQSGRQARSGSPALPPPPNATVSTNRPNTRSAPTPLPDIIGAPGQEVRNAETGRRFLDRIGLTEHSEPMTPPHLANVLFHASQIRGITPTQCSTLRAAAFLLREIDISSQADTLISRLTPQIELSIVGAISPQIARVWETSEKLGNLKDELETSRLKLDNSIETIASQQNPQATEDSHDRLQQMASELSDIKTTITGLKDAIMNQDPAPQRPSYKEALLNHTGPMGNACHPSDHARAQVAVKERQVLIDLAKDHPVSKQICTRKELITIFQTLFTSIEDNTAPDLSLKTLTVLRNGGILLELPSKEAALWLKTGTNCAKLATASGGDLTIRSRTYNIVVPFVPTSTDIEEPDTLRAIEDDNDLPLSCITAARWIKPPHRRENAQRVAHAMFHMSTPETANKLILDGLYHNMERLRPVKDKKEPMHCLKCQRWGHMAKDCRETNDTCGTCAENHRTNACTAYKTFRCANCDSKAHGSWSRQCPEFMQ